MEITNIDTKLKLKNNTRNISINSKILQLFVQELTGAELAIVFQLLPLINNDNVIIYQNKQTSDKMLSELIDKKYDTARKIFRTLKKKDVIKKVKLSVSYYSGYGLLYIFNPWIYTKGNSVYLEILNMFKDSKWKTIIDDKPDSRDSFEYALWEENVKNRDKYQCIICGEKSELEIHHISPYSTDYNNRINIKNGITLCKKHHNVKVKGSFHQKYGTHNNTYEQLQEYINSERNMLDLPSITIDTIVNKSD